MSIGERIKERRLEIDVKVTDIARAAGVTVQAVYAWESGDTKELKGPNLVAVANVLRVTERWLDTGALPKEAGSSVGYAARDTPLPYTPRPDVIDIPVFDVVASMGLGAAIPEYDTVIDHLRLTASWVRKTLPGVSSTHNLAVISAYGTSMVPTFNDGDILLVDRGVSDLRVDDVYVLEFHQELYIKRVQRMPDTSLKIISDNKVYDPIIVPAGEKGSVRVLGRVVWAWRGAKP